MITASIVLFKNSLAECQKFLDSLLNSPVDKIYLIDHSPDNALSILKDYSERVEYLYHQNNGYGGGHNVAIKRSLNNNSSFHLIMNADIVFSEDVIPALLDYMNQHENTGMIMPKVIYPDGRLQRLCKRLPSPWDLFCKRFLPSKIAKKQIRKLCLDKFDYNSILNVPWLSGCFLLCRSEILKTVHGFDESFFMYGEDIDLSRRIHRISKTIYYPYVQIIHNHAASSYHSWRMLVIHIRSILHYFLKWGFLFDKERKRFNRDLDKEILALHSQQIKTSTDTIHNDQGDLK